MATKKKRKAAKRRAKKATVKNAPKRKKKSAARRAKKSGDRFAELTRSHTKALERGEHHFAQLIKKEILKGKRKR